MSYDPYPSHRTPPSHRAGQGARTHSLHYAEVPPAYHQEARDQAYLGRRSGENRSDLRRLRSAYRRQRGVATSAVLGCFTAYVLLAAYVPDLMAVSMGAGMNLGLFLGLLQVPVMLIAVLVHEFTARRNVDPVAARLSAEQARRGVRR